MSEVVADVDRYTWYEVPDDWRRLGRRILAGSEPPEAWAPAELVPANVDRPVADFSGCSMTSCLVVGTRLLEALGGPSSSDMHVLPASVGGIDRWIIRTKHVVDVLDAENSEFLSPTLPTVFRYAFKPADVEALEFPWFTIPQMQRANTYVTDDFVSRYEALGWTGLTFIERWRS